VPRKKGNWIDLALPITFVVPGLPVVKKNNKRIITNRRTGKPMLLSSEECIGWEKRAETIMINQWYPRPPIPAGVELNCAIRSFLGHGQRPDASNLYEAPQDALEKARVIMNDYWIVSHDHSMRKRDISFPRTEIVLSIAGR
jgi:Holliday junction resolvase RusA-like endonuclease